MARNVEVKARVADPVALERRASALADSGPTLLLQDDSFFACAHGRLKLREFGDGRGELIVYQRAAGLGPRLSDYTIAPVADPPALRAVLERALGAAGRVRKQRRLYLAGATRIHVDHVEGLGDFVELEVVLAPHEAAEDGVATAHALLARLGVGADALVAGAYVDLLQDLRALPA